MRVVEATVYVDEQDAHGLARVVEALARAIAGLALEGYTCRMDAVTARHPDDDEDEAAEVDGAGA